MQKSQTRFEFVKCLSFPLPFGVQFAKSAYDWFGNLQIIRERLVSKRLNRAWKFKLSNDLIVFFDEIYCLLGTDFVSEQDCSTKSIIESVTFGLKVSNQALASVAKLKPFLRGHQGRFEVSFWSKLVGNFRQSRKFCDHKQNVWIFADAIWRAENSPSEKEVECDLVHWALQRLYAFTVMNPNWNIVYEKFIPCFDRTIRVEDDDVCSFNYPNLDIWIARMIQPGGSKTNPGFVRIQVVLFFWASIYRAEICRKNCT